MSFESDAELDDPDWRPRPIIFPVFQIPGRLATVVAWGLVVSAALTVIASLVTAVSYRRATPSGIFGQGVKIPQPSFGFADRVTLFANGAGSLTVALLVLFAVAVAAMAVRQERSEDALSARFALLVALTILGSVVVLANIAQAIVILSNSTGQFTAQYSDNKASSILGLLPAALTAVAALVCTVTRIRRSDDLPAENEG